MKTTVPVEFHEEGKYKPPRAKREVDGYCISTLSGFYQEEWIAASELASVIAKERRFAERKTADRAESLSSAQTPPDA